MAVRKTKVIKTFDPTWTYQVSAKDEKALAKLRYKDDFIGWASRVPLLGSIHPDLPGFELIDIVAAREDGEQITVDLTFEPANAGTDYPGRDPEAEPARYSVQVAGREEHILTNDYAAGISETELKALYAISNGTETDEKGAPYKDQVTTAAGLSLLLKIRKGNTHYKTGGIVYSERKIVASLSSISVATIGKRDAPPGPVGGGAANWLYIGATADPQTNGNTWQLERQWEYSPAGWDADLYAP